MKTGDIYPNAGSKISFAAAIVYAEKINLKPRKIQISKSHRGYMATLDNGFMIIEKKWYC